MKRWLRSTSATCRALRMAWCEHRLVLAVTDGHKPVTTTGGGGCRAVGFAGIAKENWWTAGGSNSRPPRCERGALPTELAAQPTASDYNSGLDPSIHWYRASSVSNFK